MHDFWTHCLGHFQAKLNAQQVNTWIKPLSISAESGQITITAPNRFVAQWVRDRFLTDIEELALAFFDKPVTLTVAVNNKTPTEASTGETPASPLARSAPVKQATEAKPVLNESRLNPHFTFASFVPGKSAGKTSYRS